MVVANSPDRKLTWSSAPFYGYPGAEMGADGESAETAVVLVVLVTAPERNAAEIARRLVDDRLAACVNIVGGVRSIYRHRDAVHDDSEALLLIKTTRGRFEALKTTVNEIHPYDLAEVIGLPVAGGHEPYLEWVAASVGIAASTRGTSCPTVTKP